MVGTFYNGSGEQVTITIGTARGALNIVSAQIQTSEGTDNIFTPCIYTAATITILTNNRSFYTSSLIGAEVTISKKNTAGQENYYWHGKVVTNCGNLDYNQEYEEIEIQAVDDLTLAKSIEYVGPSYDTAMNIIEACLPGSAFLFASNIQEPGAISANTAYTSDGFYITRVSALCDTLLINLAHVLPQDEDERVTNADVLEAVLRYLSVRNLGRYMRPQDADVDAHPYLIAPEEVRVNPNNQTFHYYKKGGASGCPVIKPQNLSLGSAGAIYEGGAQVTLLDPYKSYEIVAHFPGVTLQDEEVTETVRTFENTTTYWQKDVEHDATVKSYYIIQKYQRKSKSTYRTYQYEVTSEGCGLNSTNKGKLGITDDEPKLTSWPDLIETTGTTPMFLAVVNNEGAEALQVGRTYHCGAIHTSTAVGPLKDGESSPSGIPQFVDRLLIFGTCYFAHCISKTSSYVATPQYYEVYRRSLDVAITSTAKNPAMLVVNGSLLFSFRNKFPLYPNGLTCERKYFWTLSIYDSKWVLNAKLYLTDNNGVVHSYPMDLSTEMSARMSAPYSQYDVIRNITWADASDADGRKVPIPVGSWANIAIGIGMPNRIRAESYNSLFCGDYSNNIYLDLDFAITNKNPKADGDTDTVYGWNNDALQIDGTEVSEETNISTDDDKNVSTSLVQVASGALLTGLKNTITGETDRPEQLRVNAFARQYETSTLTLSTTLRGAPKMLAHYHNENLTSSPMTVESYVYDLATDLAEVTLVEVKGV